MNEDKKNYVIPPEGSLGLLALGDIGLEKWREARKKSEENQSSEVENGGEKKE